MKLLLTLSLLLLTLLPASAVKKIQANPINIAIQLVEKTDSTKVAKTLEYYGYTPQGKEDGYQIMRDPNGNEIRYSFNTTKYPTITVKNIGTHKALDTRLKELSFEKKGNCYERVKNQYSKYKTHCKLEHGEVLIVRCILN